VKPTGSVLLSILSSLSLLCAPCSFADQPGNGAPIAPGAKTVPADVPHALVASLGALSDETQAKLGFRCMTDEKQGVIINDVIPATPAAFSGLRVGDRVIESRLDSDVLSLTLDRDGQPVNLKIDPNFKPSVASDEDAQTQAPQGAPTSPFSLNAAQTKPVELNAQTSKPVELSAQETKPFSLNAEQRVRKEDMLKAEAAAKADNKPKIASVTSSRFNLQAKKDSLSDYRIELIVDRSNSMHKTDCPGGLSRWEWVGMQSSNMAASLAPMVPKGLTIVPFATDYDVFEHATASSIDHIFNSIHLQLGTRLYEPLADRLDRYLLHKTPDSKPLLIVVITDGRPSPKFETETVRNELIAASRRMTSPGDITVIFCQIGSGDPVGESYLRSLDTDLVSQGARYHFVHTLSFDQLTSGGLGRALSSAIKKYGSTEPTGARATLSAIPNGPPNFTGAPRFPDLILDNPRIGARGERHYINGKYFDLTQVPVDQAISITNQVDPLVREARIQAYGGGGRGRGGGHGGGHRHQNQWAQMHDDDSL
jgi:hypothetical protein